MRRLLQMLVKLYPSVWRKRYGAEYNALLEEQKPRLRDIADVLWGAFAMRIAHRRFGATMLFFAALGISVGLAVSFLVAPRYESSTWVVAAYASPATTNQPVLVGWMRSAFTDEVLTRIIEREDLYPKERAIVPMANVLAAMRKSISLMPIRKTSMTPIHGDTLAVRFQYTDPHLAQRVDRELSIALMQSQASVIAEVAMVPGHAANLPNQPNGPSRTFMVWLGLIGGLFCGLAAIAAVDSSSARTS